MVICIIFYLNICFRSGNRVSDRQDARQGVAPPERQATGESPFRPRDRLPPAEQEGGEAEVGADQGTGRARLRGHAGETG